MKDDIQEIWNQPITEDWLKSVGFKWHQHERQPERQWLLWMGGSDGRRIQSFEDLGLEVSFAGYEGATWHSWLRADTSSRYHRFIHIRYLTKVGDVVALVESLSGVAWNPENHIYGMIRTDKEAKQIQHERRRLDHQIREECAKWAEVEKDDSRTGALANHMEEARVNEAGRSKAP